MNSDRIMTIMAALCGFMSAISFSVGKLIFGVIFLFLCLGIIWTRGTGKFNDRNLYDKVTKSGDLSIDDLFASLSKLETCLGKCTKASYKDCPGNSIVWGPGPYKDMIIISKRRDRFEIRNTLRTDMVDFGDEQEQRLSQIKDVRNIDVTPCEYSKFASAKLMAADLTDQILDIVESIVRNPKFKTPRSLGKYNLYYHNSSSALVCDAKRRDILRLESTYNPFRIYIYDTSDEEMARIETDSLDAKGRPIEKDGFKVYASSKEFGTLYHDTSGKHDRFIIKTELGEFVSEGFMSVRRANIAANYRIFLDGKLIALVGGSPKLEFEGLGYQENDIICSFNDDYLVYYSAFIAFIMNLNKWLR